MLGTWSVFHPNLWMELGFGLNRWEFDSSRMKYVILIVGRSRKNGDSLRDVFIKKLFFLLLLFIPYGSRFTGSGAKSIE